MITHLLDLSKKILFWKGAFVSELRSLKGKSVSHSHVPSFQAASFPAAISTKKHPHELREALHNQHVLNPKVSRSILNLPELLPQCNTLGLCAVKSSP